MYGNECVLFLFNHVIDLSGSPSCSCSSVVLILIRIILLVFMFFIIFITMRLIELERHKTEEIHALHIREIY
ncbi:unnamed protein product, partial [Amoebophrya sp. A25]|eukprot:GSA25T00001873001.1